MMQHLHLRLFRTKAALLIGLSLLVSHSSSLAQNAQKVMTYNIRYNNPKDGENAWPNRQEKVLKLVLSQQADVVGLQEALKEQTEFMDSLLTAYGRIGVGRDDGWEKGEYSPLYYRKDRFNLRDNGTFWLSETPEMPGSKSWDAAITRICTYAQLIDKQTGKAVWVFNTHFDHKGKKARQESAKLIIKKAKEMAQDDAIVLIGDFNFSPDSEPYKTITSEFSDAFSCYKSGPKTTGRGFAVGENEGERIDHVFYSKQLKCSTYSILDENDGKNYPSDHLPVISTLRF
ncbi:MAG: endonuclease [Flavobacteriales bacterium]|nr:endonuclease [Flavobacteriales bacterium]